MIDIVPTILEAVDLPQPRTVSYQMSLDETLDGGEDTGTPVSEDYQVPFKFTGEMDEVTIQLK